MCRQKEKKREKPFCLCASLCVFARPVILTQDDARLTARPLVFSFFPHNDRDAIISYPIIAALIINCSEGYSASAVLLAAVLPSLDYETSAFASYEPG